MGQLKVKDPITGVWIPAGSAGPQGLDGLPGRPGQDGRSIQVFDQPTDPGATALPGDEWINDPEVQMKKADLTWVSLVGPQGPTGVSTIIIGNFGPGTGTPATLPPDGALVAGFTAPGSAAYQMIQGESLFYEAPTQAADPLHGHLFQYVTTTMTPAGWIDVGLIVGPEGPEGPIGPVGPERDEVFIGPDEPDPVVLPFSDIWYDTDAPEPPPRGMDDVVLKTQVYAKYLGGPYATGAVVWTVDLAAGFYLVQFSMSAVATGTGLKWVDIRMDGVGFVQAKFYYNQINTHAVLCNTPVVREVTAGTHEFTIYPSGTTMDVNDFGSIILIPCDAGSMP